ncbi:sensor domain-containing diguanylate cyclase [Sporosarcina sp. CAU 1771]
MEVSKKQQVQSFILWLLVAPPTVYIVYTYFPKGELDWLNLSLLFVLLISTMFLPIKFNVVTISLERWITFAIFFQYGVFAELLFIQIGLVVLLFSEKSALPLMYKFTANSSIYVVSSIASAAIFHGLGGKVGMLDFSQLLVLGFIYSVAYTLINNIVLKFHFFMNKQVYSLRSQGALWDYIATVIVLPFSLSLYILDLYLQNISLILVGIPFLTLLIVVKMYDTSNDLNARLTFAGEIGHELADQLSIDEVLETFLKKLNGVVPFDNAYVVDLIDDVHCIPIMGIESSKIQRNVLGISFLQGRVGANGFNKQTSKIYHNKKERKELKGIEFTQPIESVITAPVIRNYRTAGYLILTSRKKNIFEQIDLELIDILAGYLSITLEKARYFENTIEKSMRCGLTKIYNFRYLDSKLDEEIIRYHTKEISKMSILMMDIDHFKQVNDTYGHETGNDLLCGLTEILQKHVSAEETLARYGGEEFVILLPERSKEYAINLAETIRKEVNNTVFSVVPDLSEDRSPVEVSMTISIGVAAVPDDAIDAKNLMRNADRALYIGGKQAGRNRVGVYEEQLVISI